MSVQIRKEGWNPTTCSGSRVDIICSAGLNKITVQSKLGKKWIDETPKGGVSCPVIVEVDFQQSIRILASAKPGYRIVSNMPITKLIKKDTTISILTEICESC